MCHGVIWQQSHVIPTVTVWLGTSMHFTVFERPPSNYMLEILCWRLCPSLFVPRPSLLISGYTGPNIPWGLSLQKAPISFTRYLIKEANVESTSTFILKAFDPPGCSDNILETVYSNIQTKEWQQPVCVRTYYIICFHLTTALYAQPARPRETLITWRQVAPYWTTSTASPASPAALLQWRTYALGATRTGRTVSTQN